tara:strand:+ start:14884 stop:15057 length:174 start_codon:yes stop_codon:yes gene_type:complete
MKEVNFTGDQISKYACDYELRSVQKATGLFYYDLHYELQMVVLFNNDNTNKTVLIQK